MAGGYLGKISAVVSANTGDYVRKLNDSASTTRSFAKSISSDLSKASRDASRSIESILTPLQRLERAIQNAASQKLAFRGFDGAIQTVEQLRKAIEKVADRPVELQFLLKQTGLKTLEEIRQTIGSISEKNLQLALNVGGVEGLRKLRSEVQEIDGRLVNVKVETDATELDRLINVFSQIAPERVRQLKIDVETRQIEQAVVLNKQLVSVATEITAAYGRAKQQFSGFALDVQTALGPGLKATDSGLLKVLEDIENRIPITEERFNQLSKAAQAAVQAISRVGEADRAAQSLSGGQNLAVSRRGDVVRELDRAQASQQSGMGLSNAADLFARQKAAAEAVVVELGKMEAAELQVGGGVRVTTKEYERQLGILRAITAQIEQSAAAGGNAARVNAVITGSPQNFAQGRAVQGQLETQIASLNRSQRQDFKGLLTQANDLSVGDRPENLDKYLDVLQKIDFEVKKKQRINIDSAAAQSNADRLKASLDSLRGDIKFRVTGDFQSIEQAKAATESLAGRVGELGAQQAAGLQPQFGNVIRALGGDKAAKGDLSEVQKEFNILKAQFDSGLDLKVRNDEATAAFTRLKASLLDIRDLAALKITGQFQNLDQAKAAVDGVVGSLEKLGAQQALGLKGQISGALKAISDSAANPNDSALRQTAIRLSAELQSAFNKEYEIKVNADDATSEFNRLKSQREQLAKDLRQTFDALPASAQGRFIGPAADIATRLANPSASAGEIESTAAAAAKLKGEMSAVATQTARFSSTYNDAFQSAHVDSAAARLRILRQILISIGVTTGEAVARTDQLSDEYGDAAAQANGFLTKAKQIAAAERDAVAAVQAAADARSGKGRVNVGGLFARAGDVGRGGFDKISLAAQQAAFAIDDFLSVTGGFDQKIRAVQNNLTQLAFILGGTQGLFVGIGVAIASQAAIGLFKWINSGKTAEDQTKALNEALSRQKSLVEELAQAFESLGDSIARKAFSNSAEQARAFAKELEQIARKQKELRESRVSDLDPTVQAERANRNALQKRLEGATDGGQRVAILRQIEESRQREREAARAAASRPAPESDAIGRSVLATIRENEFLVGGRLTAESRRRAEARRAQAERDFAAAGNDPRLLSGVVEQRIRERQQVAGRNITAGTLFSGEATEIVRAREDVARLQQLLEALRLPANIRADESIRNFLSGINDAANGLQSAQSQVAEAIRAGIPNALLLEGVIDTLAKQIDDAQAAIKRANEEFVNSGGAPEAAANRDRVVAEQQQVIGNAAAAREAAIQRAAALTQQRIVDPQVLFDARRQRAEANLQAAGLEGGAIARQIRELEAQREVIRSRIAQAPEAQREAVRQQVAAEEAALNQQLAALEASTVALRRFTEELDRASQEAQSNLQSAQQRADDVRRASLAPGQGLAVPSDADRGRAAANLQEQRRAEQRVQDEVAQARIRAEQRAADQADPLAAVFQRLREIEEAARGGTLTPAMIEERRRLNQQVDAAVQQDPAVVAARDNSTRIEERQRAEQRGRDLAMTDAERAAREAARQAADITASFERDAGGGLPGLRAVADRQGQQDAINRLAENQIRQVAPLIAGFREERLNAMLQGPSRAALNVADAQTTEGARELNRLLRGDDPNKDVNLVELQKQTEALERVIKAIEENAAGAIVDIRG